LSPATARRPWPTWRADLVAGLTAAVVLVAVDGAYGLVAFAALGPAAVSLAFAAGIYSAVVANLVAPGVGARGPLLGGGASALALLVHPVVLELLRDPRFLDAAGAPRSGAIFAFAALGVTLAGLLQLGLSVLRAGRLVRYVPYPVHAGFMTGVAILMVLAMTAHILGVPSQGPIAWHEARPASIAIALLSTAIAIRAPRWTRPVPAVLTALAVGTAAHHAIASLWGPDRVGPVLGALSLHLPDAGLAREVIGLFGDGLIASHLGTLLWFAAALAMMSTLQTLLAGSVVDLQTGRRHDGEREILGQGLSNVVGGALGALASAGGVARSSVSLGAGARGTGSRVVYALGLLAALTVFAPVLEHLSMAALAGVFVCTAWNMIDPWTRSATRRITAALAGGRAPGRALLQGYGVMAAVATIAVWFSIGQAVVLGVLVGMAMFIVRHARNPVRRVVRATQRSSRRVRDAGEVALLRAQGGAIVVIELDGPLFFGTADAAAREIEREAASAQQVILDFARVTDVDLSGARVLLQAAVSLQAAGRRLLIAALPEDSAGLRTVREVDVQQRLAAAELHADVDLALEAAEDRLLAAHVPARAAASSLALHETMLGRGLAETELATLAGLLVQRRFARGQTLFRRGEPGDAMYVAVQGRIGIWLRELGAGRPQRRLVSFGPGVVFGEMAMLSGEPRSADGVAEEDATLLVLERAAFERLRDAHPALAARLLLNLNLHLGARLRIVTEELQAANAPG
jgi:sulfate permease, SulP family